MLASGTLLVPSELDSDTPADHLLSKPSGMRHCLQGTASYSVTLDSQLFLDPPDLADVRFQCHKKAHQSRRNVQTLAWIVQTSGSLQLDAKSVLV